MDDRSSAPARDLRGYRCLVSGVDTHNPPSRRARRIPCATLPTAMLMSHTSLGGWSFHCDQQPQHRAFPYNLTLPSLQHTCESNPVESSLEIKIIESSLLLGLHKYGIPCSTLPDLEVARLALGSVKRSCKLVSFAIIKSAYTDKQLLKHVLALHNKLT